MKGKTSPIFLAVIAVIAVLVFAFVLPTLFPKVPEPYHPDISIDPSPSELDLPTKQYTEIRLFGGGEIVSRLDVSTISVNFSTNGQPICLYGNFTVSGNLDGLIDFFILTDSGYGDFMSNGIIDNEDFIFNTTYGTTGFYWNVTLPYIFNSYSVDSWYIIYSAYAKYEGVLGLGTAFRDVTAEVYRDQTPPLCAMGNMSNRVEIGNIVGVELWVWDLRCSISSVQILANETTIAMWAGNYITFNEMLQWDTSSYTPGNYTITLAATDAVGNSQIYLLGFVLVNEPWQPPVEEAVDFGRVGFAFFAFLLVLCRSKSESEGGEIFVTIVSTIVNIVPIFGPLQVFNQVATIVSFIAAIIAIWKEMKIRSEMKKSIPKGKPDYYV